MRRRVLAAAIVLLGIPVPRGDARKAPASPAPAHAAPSPAGPSPVTTAAVVLVPGEILVKWKPGATRAPSLAAAGGRIVREHPFIGVSLVRVEDDAALARLQKDPSVLYAEPNAFVHVGVVPDDPSFTQLWGLRNTGQTGGAPGADIRATSAWNVARGDPTVRIGVLDTGIDLDHPDLVGNIWTNPGEIPGNSVDDDDNGYVDDVHGYDVVNDDGDPEDDYGHGTHVAGTIAATGDNGTGVVGVAWRASLVAIKFLDATGTGTTDGAIAAVEYALRVGVALTNNSWSGGPYTQALRDAIAAAGAANQLFVAAAGNFTSNNDAVPVYPASYDEPNIVVVAATDDTDQLAPFSNYGATSVDLGAPGVDILSCLPMGGYTVLSGTSMAAPHVTGVAALLYGLHPGISLADVRARILSRAVPIPALAGRCMTQARLDAFGALSEPDQTPPAAIDDLMVQETGSTTVRLGWTSTGDDGSTGSAAFYDLRYAPWPIDTGNFEAATWIEITDAQPAGMSETFEIASLEIATPYWFAIRAHDDQENGGPISNVVSSITLGAPEAAVEPASIHVALQASETALRTIEIENVGQGTLDYTVAVPDLVTNATRDAAPRPFRTGHVAPAPPARVPSAPPVDASRRIPKTSEDRRAGPPVLAGRGGPDGFGYRWDDSDELGGPAFAWIDISGIGTPIPLDRDDQTLSGFPIGFSFPFYGYAYEQFNASSNGFISFTSRRSLHLNQPLPNAGLAVPENLVAPFWDDLDFSTSVGNARAWYHGDATRFVVQYSDVPHFAPPGDPGPYTFQVILFPNGEIRFHYLSVGEPSGSATIGIQDYSRSVGTQVAFNAPYARDGLAVRITPVPQWAVVLEPAAGRIPAGESRTVSLRFEGAGLAGGGYDAWLRIFLNHPVGATAVVPLHLDVSGAVSDAAAELPETAALHLEGPNPVRGTARFRMQLAAGAEPLLHIYDARGRLLRSLQPELGRSPTAQFSWDGTDARGRRVASGAYWARSAGPAPAPPIRFVLAR